MEKQEKTREFNKRKALAFIRETNQEYRLMTFVRTKLNQVMQTLLPNVWFAIGGSVAAKLYGVELGRNCHDVDIIVMKSDFQRIKSILENNPLIEIDPSTSSTDSEHNTEHIAFRTINNIIIDVIASQETLTEDDRIYSATANLWLMTPLHLYKAKLNYNRWKDDLDTPLLLELVEKCYK